MRAELSKHDLKESCQNQEKHIRLMHCDSRTGNRSVCLNVYADARGGYLYSFRDGIGVEWRWSDADKQKYLKNCLTLREEVPALSSNAKLVKKLLKKAKPIKKQRSARLNTYVSMKTTHFMK